MGWLFERRLWRWAGYGLLVLLALDVMLFMGSFTLALLGALAVLLPELTLHALDLAWMALQAVWTAVAGIQGALNEVLDDAVRFALKNNGWSDASMAWLAWALAWMFFGLTCLLGVGWVRLLVRKR